MLATTIQHSNTTPHHQRQGDNHPPPQNKGDTPHKTRGTGLLPQDPTVCLMIFSRPPTHTGPAHVTAMPVAHPVSATTAPTPSRPHPTKWGASWCSLERR